MQVQYFHNIQKLRLPLILIFICQVKILSAQSDSISDIEGNIYKTIKIGNQWWMAQNLRTKYFDDNTAIPFSSGLLTSSADDFKEYFKFPNNDSSLVSQYGLLYSWGTISNSDGTISKKICPEGWHIPDTTEWGVLAMETGGYTTAGGKLKAISLAWNSPNTGASDAYDFGALPAGDCNTSGFTNFGQQARFWTTQTVSAGGAGRVYMAITYNSSLLQKGQFRNVNTLSLRCIKDNTSANMPIDIAEVQPYLILKGGILSISEIPLNSLITIYSIRGIVLEKVISRDNSISINISKVANGLLIINIQSGHTYWTNKLLKY